jgi:hypothetical protein
MIVCCSVFLWFVHAGVGHFHIRCAGARRSSRHIRDARHMNPYTVESDSDDDVFYSAASEEEGEADGAEAAEEGAQPACHDAIVARDKQCTICVHWTPDRSQGREWFTRAQVAVHFADCADLLQQLNRLCRAGRWWRVQMSAPDMGDYDALTYKQELYGMTGCYTLNAFPRAVDNFCNERVAFIRRVLRSPDRAVRVRFSWT